MNRGVKCVETERGRHGQQGAKVGGKLFSRDHQIEMLFVENLKVRGDGHLYTDGDSGIGRKRSKDCHPIVL